MLQNIDSKIMSSVLLELIDNDIAVLPVHDSVLCKLQDKDTVIDVMRRAYKAVMKLDCKIDY